MTPNEEIACAIRAAAAAAFERGAEMVIGYQRAADGLLCPAVLDDPGQVEHLDWDQTCAQNLANFLRRFCERKVAVVANGCAGRSIAILLAETQLRRERLEIIGVPCRGTIDAHKVERAFGPFAMVSPTNGGLRIRTRAGEKELPLEDYLHESCRSCRHPESPIADIRVEGEARRPAGDPLGERIRAWEEKPAAERLAYFRREMEKCIRCYACRQACPMCYCETCFVDVNSPRWLGTAPTFTDNAIWNTTRVYHLTGRCSECGACDRACPQGVDLMFLVGKMNREVRALYGSEAGLTVDDKPAFTTFRPDDPDFFWGTEGHVKADKQPGSAR
jgi:ferredoxin/intracellular sulfur oxidation DsrE/DsrF family protein